MTMNEPHILVLGDRCKPNQVFVIIHGRALEKPTLFKAIDTCFKMFYVLDMEYPWQCSTTWETLQKVVYLLDDKKPPHKTSPAVIALRAALKQ